MHQYVFFPLMSKLCICLVNIKRMDSIANQHSGSTLEPFLMLFLNYLPRYPFCSFGFFSWLMLRHKLALLHHNHAEISNRFLRSWQKVIGKIFLAIIFLATCNGKELIYTLDIIVSYKLANFIITYKFNFCEYSFDFMFGKIAYLMRRMTRQLISWRLRWLWLVMVIIFFRKLFQFCIAVLRHFSKSINKNSTNNTKITCSNTHRSGNIQKFFQNRIDFLIDIFI